MDKILTFDQMKNMSTDNIVELYRNGYTLENNNKDIQSIQELQNYKIESMQGVTFATFLELVGLGAVLWFIFLRR